MCSELVRGESREFLDSINQLSGQSDTEEMQNNGASSDLMESSDERPDALESTFDAGLSSTSPNRFKWDEFNSNADIMFSTPLPGIGLSHCHAAPASPQLCNTSFSVSSSSLRHVPIRNHRPKKMPSIESIPRSPWLVRGASDALRYSPVKKVVPGGAPFVAQQSDDPKLPTPDPNGKQLQHTPMKTVPLNSLHVKLPTKHANQVTQYSPVSKRTRYSPVERIAKNVSASSSQEDIDTSLRPTMSDLTHAATLARKDSQITGSVSNDQETDIEYAVDSAHVNAARSSRLSPICEGPPTNLQSRSVSNTPIRDSVSRFDSRSGDSFKTTQYSPVRRATHDLPKIARATYLAPVGASRQLPLTSVDLLNTYHESFKQPHLTLPSNTPNPLSSNGHYPRADRCESEIPSLPDLIDETNEGSDYESSDFIDTITPNLEVSGYSSLNISTVSAAKISGAGDVSHSRLIQSPNHSSTPKRPVQPPIPSSPANPVAFTGADSTTPGTERRAPPSAQASPTVPLSGKIVGARIRNGEVEYKVKFLSVWKSADELESHSVLVQNFMNTLTSRTSFLSLMSDDSTSRIQE
ncbi:hypothetical protein K493DRAFT_101502 [Basidiobolus meristosporus CBS 931.73]|uniref:Chromo domain-containing protein n=1 Tax=Basidiobolus meristosporus CBS 931.73 TaxID=1314790 RepID=A0A1Y1ZBB6_9FUNG|nr:hypothetical protein K493DRAFT_101502 [Basidiobolus meristosporus CBS 931.73]|eukprot:ORY07476.1 hypothetical protein K493DRAFT_101502 [Basidiobolus meristosporus CBS 931.73]